MKYLKGLLTGLFLLAGIQGSALAEGAEVDLHGGLAFGSGGYSVGFGGGGGVFFPLEESFSLGGSAAFYTFNYTATASLSYGGGTVTAGGSSTTNSIEAMLSGKYKFHLKGNKNLVPYIRGGAGISYLMMSSTSGGSSSSGGMGVTQTINISSNTFNPMLEIGGGVEFPAGENMSFFAQARLALVIALGGNNANISGSSSYGGNISGSVSTGGGGTFTYFPIEGGVRFDLK